MSEAEKQPEGQPADDELSYWQLQTVRESFVTEEEAKAYFKPRRGRPEKDISLDDVERICRICVTDQELAVVFGVDVRTIERRKKQKAFKAAMERGKVEAMLSIRRAQFRIALGDGKGATTMCIWLGKQILNQKDKIQNEHTGVQGGPIQIEEIRKRLARQIARRSEARLSGDVPKGTE